MWVSKRKSAASVDKGFRKPDTDDGQKEPARADAAKWAESKNAGVFPIAIIA